jgi:hypothetical protein
MQATAANLQLASGPNGEPAILLVLVGSASVAAQNDKYRQNDGWITARILTSPGN